MTQHVSPRPTGPAPDGNVGPSNPNKQVITAPRKVTAPGKPSRDPNRGGSLGTVDGAGVQRPDGS